MISVIIPIYNVEKYLKKCIESVINQSYDDLEIILVNDGSTDNSLKICNEYKNIDNRIKVINKENGGLSDARNYGLKVATGDFIAFLDSDDWIDMELYATLYDLIKKYDSDIAICNFKYVNNENEELNKSNKINIFSNIEALNQIYGENYIQMIVAWNKLYKKDILEKTIFPKGRIHEDEFLTPILLHRANRIVYTESELIYYRQNPNSIMNSKFNEKRFDYLYALENRIEYFQRENLDELYRKSISMLISSIIMFYNKTSKSDLIRKRFIMKDLKRKLMFLKIKYREISKIDIIKIMVFNFSPKMYISILEKKSKFKFKIFI